ncbi:MAG TPA: site-2 protease family protein [Candidatus Eremiobacteraeota bacterium]|nr:MAG: Peptidase family M50 [bacterium ADurb.Bin363]HPZ07353.1 site-2 protease family protein [Candidatus Eremiobacteraeota bacterium]
MFTLSNPETLFLILPGLILSITVHEFSHAYTAYMLGDGTAWSQGRVSLNPVDHFDPYGFLFIILSLASGFGFGWGKPVPVNPAKLRSGKDIILVTAAGPFSNFFIAFTAAYLHKLLIYLIPVPEAIELFLFYLVVLNVGLGIFNLAPVPPLDGFTILTGLLPYELAKSLEGMRAYGYIPLIIFIVTPLNKLWFGYMYGIMNFILTAGDFPMRF